MPVPDDYAERVYAGVLGKIIGVYLGRPFEGWTYERIMAELGEINYYVHERRDLPLTRSSHRRRHLRHLHLSARAARLRQRSGPYPGADRPDLAQLHHRAADDPVVGRLGNSTEHTAFLRLKHGIQAPASGSIALNGKVVAEQIGVADLHRRLGDGRAGRPRAGRRPGPPRRQRQPRRRGDLRRAGAGGDGGAGLRRARHQTSCSIRPSRSSRAIR